MMVKRGWSLEYGKRKFDVGVDESDLLRMIAERTDSGPEAENPEKVAARMAQHHVFLAMDAEAQAWVSYSLAEQEPGQAEVHKATAAKHRAARNTIIDHYVVKAEPAG
jgi:hypothetical protein